MTDREIKELIKGNVKYIRKQLGLTQVKMAEQLELPHKSYQKIEELGSLKYSTLLNLSTFCKISASTIIFTNMINSDFIQDQIKKANPRD